MRWEGEEGEARVSYVWRAVVVGNGWAGGLGLWASGKGTGRSVHADVPGPVATCLAAVKARRGRAAALFRLWRRTRRRAARRTPARGSLITVDGFLRRGKLVPMQGRRPSRRAQHRLHRTRCRWSRGSGDRGRPPGRIVWDEQ